VLDTYGVEEVGKELGDGVLGVRIEAFDGDVDGQKRCGRWISRRALLLRRFIADHGHALA
jgi:hypothetical protein